MHIYAHAKLLHWELSNIPFHITTKINSPYFHVLSSPKKKEKSFEDKKKRGGKGMVMKIIIIIIIIKGYAPSSMSMIEKKM